MEERFIYGKDIETYLDKALEKMRETYPWAQREMFRKEYTYAIEEEAGREVFVSYYRWSNGQIDRKVLDVSAEEFIDSVINDHQWNIECANPVSRIFEVPFDAPTDCHGWMLERYEFRSHELGGYSSFVQAGDRTTGGSRDFFLPPRFFEGSWSDFLDQYCELVPGYSFGLYREDLEAVNGLKSFLGFSDKISPVVWDYVLARSVPGMFLFENWTGFLELLYLEGGRVTGIRFYDHCRWEKREKSMGKGGPFDPFRDPYMYLRTEVHEEDLEGKTLEEILEYIDSVRKQYSKYDLIPSFTLAE